MIKVSIIVAKEGTKNLNRCIKSILDQKLKEIEIFTNGNIDEFKDSRIHYIKSDEKYNTYNAGIKLSKGKYICFANENDIFSLDYLKILFLRAEEKKADICKGCYYCPDSKQLENLSNNKYLIPLYGTLYNTVFIKKVGIIFGVNDLDFCFASTYLAKKISICNSAKYSHYLQTDFENKLTIIGEDWLKRYNSFLLFLNHFLFIQEADEQEYTDILVWCIRKYIINTFGKIKDKKNIKTRALDFIQDFYKFVIYKNDTTEAILEEYKNLCQ